MTADVSGALLVDLYELTMAEALRRAGMAEAPATFSLFVRRLPPGRGYLVAAGLDDCLAHLEELRFGAEDLAALERLGIFGADFLDWLGRLRFTGAVRAVPEGTVVFAEEPLLEVDAPMVEAQLVETFLLNQVTVQTLLASKAARFRHAAGDRAVVDFALRRTQGVDAAMKLARACRLVGLDGTSNVAGADRYGLAAAGTMAHSFVQAHHDEVQAFRHYAETWGDRTILLVDTYDTPRGVERAVQVASEMEGAGTRLRGIRLDSGDLGALAHDARRRLDEASLGHVRIFASGDLDEHRILRLLHEEAAPIDGFGVGSSLGVSSDAPTLDTVYKLVCFDGRPVRKTSPGKRTWPGAKQVWRAPDRSGDVLSLADEPAPGDGWEPLLATVMAGGRRTADGRRSLDEAAGHFARSWAGLPGALKHLTDPSPLPVAPSDGLRALVDRLDAAAEDRNPGGG